MARPGRPEKVPTPAIVDKICQYMAAANNFETAAAASGISRSTAFRWQARGREEIARLNRPGTRPRSTEEKYVDFVEKTEQARATADAALVVIVRAAAPKTWQAAAWLLERRDPQRWGRVTRELAKPVEQAAAIVTAIEVMKQLPSNLPTEETSRGTEQ